MKHSECHKVQGIFKSKNNGYSKEWSLDYEKLKEMTNQDFADKVKEDFDNMYENIEFRADVIKKVHPDDKGYPNGGTIFVTLGHFIYSHIWIFSISNGYIRQDILNQEYFEDIVQPHMNQIGSIKKRYGHLNK